MLLKINIRSSFHCCRLFLLIKLVQPDDDLVKSQNVSLLVLYIMHMLCLMDI